MADKHANSEVAKVLAPICFLQFHQQPGAEAKLVELKGINSFYDQASFIEKSGEPRAVPIHPLRVEVFRESNCNTGALP